MLKRLLWTLTVAAASATLSGLGETEARAQHLSVGAGSSISLGSASFALGCSDLIVAGSVNLGPGSLRSVRDVTLAPTGILDAGTASLELSGDWSASGSFQASTSVVRFVDGCNRSTSSVGGTNTFYDLELLSDSGRRVEFASGETTTVTGNFAAMGADATNRLEIRSTSPGQEASLDLSNSAVASFVDVADIHAIGAQISLDSGSVLSGNTQGWTFGAAVPALGLLGSLALGFALAGAGVHLLRDRRTH